MVGVQNITLEPDWAGQRVDNFLITYLKLPRQLIYRWLRKGEVRINKKRIQARYRLQARDVLRVPPFIKIKEKKPIPVSLNHLQYLESSILYENNNYLIINKPSGIAVHGGSGVNSGLIERLRLLRPHEKKLELVHRIDKETSGCLIVAKNYSTLIHFHNMLKKFQIKKIYHALVQGKWPSKNKTINLPLKKYVFPNGERLVRVNYTKGKTAQTTIEILKYFEKHTLLKALPQTGRTHQIRVHLAAYNHAIICDKKYGYEQDNYQFYMLGFKRLFLHAYGLEFNDPVTAKNTVITAPYDTACKTLLAGRDSSISSK